MEHLLLLHGAIGSASQLQPLADRLSPAFKVHTLNFSGHGGRPVSGEQFSIPLFAGDVLQFLQERQLDKISVFGYSMGGYVAMYLAKHYPEKIGKIVTLATKFHWNETMATSEIKMLDPEKIEQKIPSFAHTLKDRHTAADWKEVLRNTIQMITALGNDNTLKPNDYAGITTPALLLLGDRDKMVSLEETVAIYKSLPAACMGILPASHHPIEQTDMNLLAFMIKGFLAPEK